MGDEVKKISFGFSKLAKKKIIVSRPSSLGEVPREESKVEFIDCLEGKSIKLKDPVKDEQKVLVIPLKKQVEDVISIKSEVNINTVNVDSKVKELDIGAVESPVESGLDSVASEGNNASEKSIIKEETTRPSVINSKSENLTLDEIAAKEILEELNRQKKQEETPRIFSVPLTSNAPSGEKESTIDDYDNIPVDAFGLAMLRGMGWAPGKGIGKNEKLVVPSLPTLRPKGMGLGADKVIKVAVDSNVKNDDLKMIKGSFVRIVAGPHKDVYGQIEGFDDESGRLIVKLALKNVSVSLNEFMVQLVDKNEFTKNSKVINVGKYEQYKEDEGKDTKFKSQEMSNPRKTNKTDNQMCDINKSKSTKSERYSKHHSSASESESSDKKHRSIPKKNKKSAQNPGEKSYKPSKSSSEERSRSPSKISTSSSKREAPVIESYKKKSSHKSRPVSGRYNSSSSSESDNDTRDCARRNRGKNKSRHSSASSDSSSSSGYSRRNKVRTRKKKPSSHKQRSRSRSRSPRKHKSHKKHKKSKYS